MPTLPLWAVGHLPLPPRPRQVRSRRSKTERRWLLSVCSTPILSSLTRIRSSGGTVVDDDSNALSDVSMITNPGDYGEHLPDCMIIDPPETLQDELFYVSDLWDPNLSTPEVLPDIQPPQLSSCSSAAASSSSYVPDVVTHRAPLTAMTNT